MSAMSERATMAGEPSVLEAALGYADRGWEIFPTPPGEKKGYKSAEHSNGRRWGATKDPEEIKRDWSRWPDAGIGIPTGPDNGIFVVDADTPEGHDVDGIASLRQLEAERGKLPKTLMAESPSGSLHLYFAWPDGATIRNSTSKIAPGIDVRGNGGMTIAPPSLKPGIGLYRWINEGTPIADAPDWLIDLCIATTNYGPRSADGESESGDNPEATIIEVSRALSIIPNADADRDLCVRIGMATKAATGNSAEGFALFDQWRQGAPGYDARRVAEKWRGFHPDEIGFGTLRWLANQVRPGWHDELCDETEAALRAANRNALSAEGFMAAIGLTTAFAAEPGADGKKQLVIPGTERVEMPEMRTATPKAQERQSNEPPRAEEPGETFATGPVDLWAMFEPPPLPAGLLPKAIEEFAMEQGELMGADPSGLAMAALTVCAAAIPDSIQLQVKRHDRGWKESARLWTGLIADPSGKKTPIMREAARPLFHIDNALARKYAEAKAKYDALPADEKKTAERPRQTRLRIEDTTMEAAQEVLRDSPDGVLCFQDELSGWFGGMDRYSGHRGAMKDRGFWLQSWNGGTFAINRVSRASGVIENLSVSMLGGIQPDLIRKLAAETVDDGLLQRIFPIVLRPATIGKDEPTSNAVDRYGSLVEHLHAAREPFDDLKFDDGATAIRRQLEKRHLDLMTCESLNKKLAAHIGKYDGLFARLCLLWHCIEHSHEELPAIVTEETARRVEKFLHGFLLPHAVAFYAGVLRLSNDHDRLAAVAGYILSRKLEWITNRDVQRGDRTMRSLGKQDVESIFHQLEALGWIDMVPGRYSSPPRWAVNHQVHVKFRERAASEAERRSRERAMIAELFTKNAGNG
jgi:hypothetical protein